MGSEDSRSLAIKSTDRPEVAIRPSVTRKWLWLPVVTILMAALALVTESEAIDPREQAATTNAPAHTTSRASDDARHSSRPESTREGLWMVAQTSETAWFMDQQRISRAGSTVRAWVTVVYAVANNRVRHIVEFAEYDCDLHRRRSLAGEFYDEAGGALFPVEQEEFRYVIPGTAEEGVLQAACSDLDSWGAAVPVLPVPAGLTAIQAADSYFETIAPNPTSAALFGVWGQNDCVDTIQFLSDGTFLLSPSGARGRWVLNGNQLVTYSGGTALTLTIHYIARNGFRGVGGDGAPNSFQRCGQNQ